MKKLILIIFFSSIALTLSAQIVISPVGVSSNTTNKFSTALFGTATEAQRILFDTLVLSSQANGSPYAQIWTNDTAGISNVGLALYVDNIGGSWWETDKGLYWTVGTELHLSAQTVTEFGDVVDLYSTPSELYFDDTSGRLSIFATDLSQLNAITMTTGAGAANLAVTFQGSYKSRDGTTGFTGTCTIVGLVSITVKNGLITACS